MVPAAEKPTVCARPKGKKETERYAVEREYFKDPELLALLPCHEKDKWD